MSVKALRGIGVAAAAGALLFTGANISAASAPAPAAAPSVQQPVPYDDPVVMDVTSANWDQAMDISKRKAVIIKVGATWCGPCQQLDPVIKGYANDDKGKWTLGLVDGDQSPDIVKKLNVDGYPTMVVFRNGQESKSVQRWVGYDDSQRQQLRDWVNKAMAATD